MIFYTVWSVGQEYLGGRLLGFVCPVIRDVGCVPSVLRISE